MPFSLALTQLKPNNHANDKKSVENERMRYKFNLVINWINQLNEIV